MQNSEQTKKEETNLLLNLSLIVLMVALSVYLAYYVGKLCYSAFSTFGFELVS